jgi:hypothetical protein
MNKQTTQYIGWALSAGVAFIMLSSAMGKLSGAQEGLDMAKNLGIDASSFKTLGIIEVVAVILFLIPQTGILGTLMLVAYMGGAIATHLQHGFPMMAPIAISAFIWCVAVFRFPELRSRLFGAMGA